MSGPRQWCQRLNIAHRFFRPGFDLGTERERRAAVGLAGNQTVRAEQILKSLGLPVDVIGTSDGWGVEKPSPAFFARLIEEAGCAAGSVLYVGDRLDNDIRPAQHVGLSTALIRRGPWGFIGARRGMTSHHHLARNVS